MRALAAAMPHTREISKKKENFSSSNTKSLCRAVFRGHSIARSVNLL